MPDASVTEHDPSFRLPILPRAFLVVFFLVWCGIGIANVVGASANNVAAGIFAGAFVTAGAAFQIRAYRVCVILEPKDLVVRNLYRTRRVSIKDLDGFRVGAVGSGQPFARRVYVLVGSGTVIRLDVTRRSTMGSRGKKRINGFLETLEHWRTERQPK